MFNSGQRPAVNAGLSVSRVGGAAQIKAMKKVSGKIKLELANYNELAAFSQFASELDDSTKEVLEHGERLMEILKQRQYAPLNVVDQVVIIYAVINKYLKDIKIEDIDRFEAGLITYVRNQHPEIKKEIIETGDLSDDSTKILDAAISKFKEKFE